jgi:acetolactate synthase I/III small subunit
MEQIIQIWLENKPGALMRVAGILTAKGLNIDNLIVGPDGEDRNVSKMTIVADIEPRFRVRVVQEMNRLVNVILAKDATIDQPCQFCACSKKVLSQNA